MKSEKVIIYQYKFHVLKRLNAIAESITCDCKDDITGYLSELQLLKSYTSKILLELDETLSMSRFGYINNILDTNFITTPTLDNVYKWIEQLEEI